MNTHYYIAACIFGFLSALFLFISAGHYFAAKREERRNGYMTDDEFTILFYRGIQRLANVPLNHIADELLVSRPTVSRWAKGKNLPHGSLRASIIEKLNNIKK